jgi:hypothetical protein
MRFSLEKAQRFASILSAEEQVGGGGQRRPFAELSNPFCKFVIWITLRPWKAEETCSSQTYGSLSLCCGPEDSCYFTYTLQSGHNFPV